MDVKKTALWEEYTAGLSYQKAMGFAGDFPSFVKFKEGEQWPAATKNTASLPRPVFNVVDMFIRNKRSSITNQPITIQYSPVEFSADENAAALADEGAKDFTDYARQLWEDCEQDELNNQFLDDAATLGTGVLHYFYDPSVIGGGEKPYIGEIRGEIIDPLNIFFGNPQIREVQRQPYIIIAQRMDAADVEREAREEGLSEEQIALIKGDTRHENQGYAAAKQELSNRKKITVLTKYYRKGGSVLRDRCTEQVEIIKGRSLTPPGAAHTITRYPIVVLNWYYRKASIFGIGECQTLIPAQKAINFLKAMELLSAERTAWPKVLVQQGVTNQPITNEPGEIITVNSRDGLGVSYLNPPAMSSGASALAQSIFDLMRTVSGVNEVASGEPLGSSISASAIIALQSQAVKPIEEVQNHFWRAIKQVGLIWEDLIKAYYSDERYITVTDTVAADDPADRTRAFTGAAYADIGFRLKVDVGASSHYSESLSVSTLDRFLDAGYITPYDYVDLAPRHVVPWREQIKKKWKEDEAMQAAAMQQLPVGMEQLPGMQQPAGAGGANLPPVPQAPTV